MRFPLALFVVVVAACGGNEIAPPPPSPPPPPPTSMALSPAAVDFRDTAGTADPLPLGVTITSAPGTLSDLSIGSITYQNGASWLSASLGSSTTTATLTLTPSIAGLAPGTYTATVPVTSSGASNSPRSVRVSLSVSAGPPPPPSEVLLLAANIASCASQSHDEQTAALLDGLAGTIVTAGDNVFPTGTLANYQQCYEPSWGRHKARTRAALGNHDYEPGGADGAFDYWGNQAGPRGLGYYSFDVGDWHVIVLNDNVGFMPFAGTAQAQWLHADLTASTRRCTLAVWHSPLFLSSNSPGFTTRSEPRPIWDELYAAGVDVVVNGQQHHYERMAPMAPDGSVDGSRGIRQWNVGTGGESADLPTAAVHPNSLVRSISFGVLKLTLRADRYDWQFVALPGDAFTDTGTATCH